MSFLGFKSAECRTVDVDVDLEEGAVGPKFLLLREKKRV